ncbi:MAG: histidine phosphatase family protein [Lachnospiraceae bacterium]|nr:histidine phosphatase family protein [Lachnospiraceae bacterium]
MKSKLRILLLRHGQTKGNQEKRYIGLRSQEPLSREGTEFLKANERNYPNAIELYTSPALRCLATAKLIYPRLYPKRIVVEELGEMDFGIFEGKNYEDMKDLPEYREWVEGGCEGLIPGGENRADFIARTMKGFGKVVDGIENGHIKRERISVSSVNKFTVADRGNEMYDAVIVAHGGTIMAVLSSLTGEDYFSFEAAPGEGYGFTVDVR